MGSKILTRTARTVEQNRFKNKLGSSNFHLWCVPQRIGKLFTFIRVINILARFKRRLNFTCAESNANEQNILLLPICIRFGTCEVRRLNRALEFYGDFEEEKNWLLTMNYDTNGDSKRTCCFSSSLQCLSSLFIAILSQEVRYQTYKGGLTSLHDSFPWVATMWYFSRLYFCSNKHVFKWLSSLVRDYRRVFSVWVEALLVCIVWRKAQCFFFNAVAKCPAAGHGLK